MQERERLVLYTVVLILALAVGFLAWRVEGGAKISFTGPLSKDVGDYFAEAVRRELDAIEERIAVAVTDSLVAQIEVSEDTIGKAVVEAIGGQLAGIEGRVADAVYDKLEGGVVCESGCSNPPPVPAREPVGKNFTFLFDNAYLDPERQVTRDSKGVKLDRHHVKRLDLIAKAFRACQTTKDGVSFHVAGYSSTAEFRMETGAGSETLSNTNELNLATANLRMANVANYLESEGFKVEAEPWGSIAALQRPYIDDFEPGVDQQALNRTVFVQVTAAGRCDLDQLAPPPT